MFWKNRRRDGHAKKELETQFIISVGTNSLINLFFQGLFWVFIFNFSSKKSKQSSSKSKFKNLSLLLLSYFLAYSIYAELRFYESNLYDLSISIT